MRFVVRASWMAALLLTQACAEDGPTVEGRTLARWTVSLQSSTVGERVKAAQVMGEFGPAALKAAPELVKLLADNTESVRMAAAYALPKLGREVAPVVEPLLSDTDLLTRFYAAVALVRLDPEHAAAGKALVGTLMGVGNTKMSERARQETIKVGAPIVPRLVPLLDDPYAPARAAVIEALTGIKDGARPAVPKLIEQLAHQDARIRRLALRALASIGPQNEVKPAIEKLTTDVDAEVARTAKEMLLYVAPPPPELAGAGD